MIFKISFPIIGILFLTVPWLYADTKKPQQQVESDQQIGDFSLTGYGEKGKKSWDLSGKSADIFTEVVKLNKVIGNLYGKDENIKLTADRGDFNKNDGKVHLEQDVVITTSSGAKLTTDSLDWDRKNQLVTTEDPVNIQRDNMVIVAQGAKGEPNLKKVALEKDVRLDINPPPAKENQLDAVSKTGMNPTKQEKTVVTCDGPLEVDYDQNIATFNNNVKVEREGSVIYSDKMEVYFIISKEEEKKVTSEPDKNQAIMNNKIDKIIAKGNVRVVRGENVSYSDEAIYSAQDKKLVLTGRPRLVISSTEGISNASFGN
jgi:LPS export ABC transporter protein LptC